MTSLNFPARTGSGRADADAREIAGPGAPVLRPGRNCWRIERARQAAVIVDAQAYFRIVKQALKRARRSVLLLAWDFAEYARLDPDASHPDEPDEIGPLLEDLVARNPDLNVRILVWNQAALLAMRRSRLPGAQAVSMNRERLRYILDDSHPANACHHQKVLVIDDALAFCGGMDLAGNRWDTRAHHRDDPRRRKPNGAPFEAHHDVMLAVDGDAARALGDLARQRLARATGEHFPPVPPGGDPWPRDLVPDFRDIAVGVARTLPRWRGQPEIREVEQLYLDMIAAARTSIYLESQYLAAESIGSALERRLGEPDGPEVVIVNPKRSPSWLEQVAMDNARTAILTRLMAADRYDRFRLFAALTDGAEIVVHSKIMVVDDRLLRIGSANLNSRSMGVDTECDLALEAHPGEEGADEVRRRIRFIRDSLLGEHLGIGAERFGQAVEREGSLIGAIDRLNGSSARTLAAFPPPRPTRMARLAQNRLTDPIQPAESPSAWRLAVVGALAGLAALSLARRFE